MPIIDCLPSEILVRSTCANSSRAVTSGRRVSPSRWRRRKGAWAGQGAGELALGPPKANDNLAATSQARAVRMARLPAPSSDAGLGRPCCAGSCPRRARALPAPGTGAYPQTIRGSTHPVWGRRAAVGYGMGGWELTHARGRPRVRRLEVETRSLVLVGGVRLEFFGARGGADDYHCTG